MVLVQTLPNFNLEDWRNDFNGLYMALGGAPTLSQGSLYRSTSDLTPCKSVSDLNLLECLSFSPQLALDLIGLDIERFLKLRDMLLEN